MSVLNNVYNVKSIIKVWKSAWFTIFSKKIINFFLCLLISSDPNTSNFFLTAFFLTSGDLASTEIDWLLINNLGCSSKFPSF